MGERATEKSLALQGRPSPVRILNTVEYHARAMGSGDVGAVYSTRHGKLCPACGEPVAHCSCERNVPSRTGDGIVRVGRETKGRRGSGVTVISGVPLGREELTQLGVQLKKRCGCGGTVRSDGVIEIQGDHRDRLVKELEGRGWVVRRSGG